MKDASCQTCPKGYARWPAEQNLAPAAAKSGGVAAMEPAAVAAAAAAAPKPAPSEQELVRAGPASQPVQPQVRQQPKAAPASSNVKMRGETADLLGSIAEQAAGGYNHMAKSLWAVVVRNAATVRWLSQVSRPIMALMLSYFVLVLLEWCFVVSWPQLSLWADLAHAVLVQVGWLRCWQATAAVARHLVLLQLKPGRRRQHQLQQGQQAANAAVWSPLKCEIWLVWAISCAKRIALAVGTSCVGRCGAADIGGWPLLSGGCTVCHAAFGSQMKLDSMSANLPFLSCKVLGLLYAAAVAAGIAAKAYVSGVPKPVQVHAHGKRQSKAHAEALPWYALLSVVGQVLGYMVNATASEDFAVRYYAAVGYSMAIRLALVNADSVRDLLDRAGALAVCAACCLAHGLMVCRIWLAYHELDVGPVLQAMHERTRAVRQAVGCVGAFARAAASKVGAFIPLLHKVQLLQQSTDQNQRIVFNLISNICTDAVVFAMATWLPALPWLTSLPVPVYSRATWLFYAKWHKAICVALLVPMTVPPALCRACRRLRVWPAVSLFSLKFGWPACRAAQHWTSAVNTAAQMAHCLHKISRSFVQRPAASMSAACGTFRCVWVPHVLSSWQLHCAGMVKSLGRSCTRARSRVCGKDTQGSASAKPGLSHADKPGSNQHHEDHTDCVVCFDAARSVALIPCGHVVLCGGCFASLQKQARHAKCGGLPCCPVCRTEVKKHVGGLIVS